MMSSIDDLIEAARTRWLQTGIKVLPGVDESHLAHFEEEHEVQLPGDLRRYFSVVNGMESEDFDDLFLRFLPMQEVRRVTAELAFKRGIPDYREIIRTLPNARAWFPLVDYSLSCHVYAIRLTNDPHGTCEVRIICGSEHDHVADSWSEFLGVYLSDPNKLFA